MITVRHWTGREARALRRAVRMSVRAFAEELGVNMRTVSKWEKLRSGTVPRPDTQAILDTALERAGDAAQRRFQMLLLAETGEASCGMAGVVLARPWERPARAADERRDMSREEEAESPDLDAGTDDLLRKWDEVWRREFLKTGALAAAGPLGLPSGAVALGGQDLMDAHTALRAAHGRIDNLHGSGAVYQQAVDQHRQILAWHSTVQAPGERRRIAAFASNTGGFVAFLSYDLGLRNTAFTHYRDAVAHARRAGDLSHRVNLFGQMSRILADQGRYDRAFDMADGALHLAGTKTHPAVRSWLHAIRAFHHAALGEVRAMRADLDTAWALLERARDGEIPMYIGYLDSAEIHKWTGHAIARVPDAPSSLLELGRTALHEAHAAWPDAHFRGAADLLTATARMHTALGDRDAAAASAARAITIAAETGSARNLRAALTAQAAVTTAAVPS